MTERIASTGFTEEQRLTALNYIISGEIKALTGAAVAHHPSWEFTSSQIEVALSDMQGTPPVWAESIATTHVKGFARGKILHARQQIAERGRHGLRPGNTYTTYEVREEWLEKLAAASGLALEWTLEAEHENIGLANLFGRTLGTGQNQAPTTRYKVLDYLLDNPGIGPTDIWEAIGPKQYTQNGIQHHIRRLGHLGMLAIVSRIIDYNPEISINRGILDYSPVTDEGLYSLVGSTLQETYLRTGRPIAITTLVDLVQRCYEREPDWDLNEIRRNAISMFHLSSPKGWGIILEPDEHKTKTYTASVHPRHKKSIKDLVDRIKSLSNPKTCGRYADVAETVIGDRGAVRYVIEKGLRFSSHGTRQRGEEPLSQQILKTARAIGPAAIRHIVAELHNQGLQTATNTVGQYLADFAARGELQATVGRRHPTTRAEVIYYSAPQTRPRT